jgi:NADH-quinone oxidoreductase subunit G
VLYKAVRAADRLTAVRVNGADSAVEFAAAAAGALFREGGVAIVGSGRSSVEEQFLTRRLADALGASAWLVSRVGVGDGLLISADRNPNVRGALLTGLIRQLPAPRLTELAAAIDAGAVRTVVSVGEDLAAAGLSPEQMAKVAIVYLGTHADATSAAARIVLPTLTVFEKSGTFVNQQFRLQKFAAAVPGPVGATDDLAVLAKLAAAAAAGASAAGGSPAAAPAAPATLDAVWQRLAAEIPALGPIHYRNLPDTGLLLDSTPWTGLSFAEGASLHHQPAKAAATA